MTRFTLRPGGWYGMVLTYPPGGQRVSPIFCHAAVPRQSGAGLIDLRFFHAEYPEGVQDKDYVLRVLRREHGYLLALNAISDGERCVLLTDLSPEWFEYHYPESARIKPANLTPAEWLQRQYPGLR